MVIMIGGTMNYESGSGGETLDIVKLTVLELVGLMVAVILMVIGIRLYYVWFTRIRPRIPSTDSDWNTDCEFPV